MFEDARVNVKLSELNKLMDNHKCFEELKKDILDISEFTPIYAKCIDCEYGQQGAKLNDGCLFCDLSDTERVYTMEINVNKFLQILEKYRLSKGFFGVSPIKIEILYEDLKND